MGDNLGEGFRCCGNKTLEYSLQGDLSIPFFCCLLPVSEEFSGFFWHSLSDLFFLSYVLTIAFMSLMSIMMSIGRLIVLKCGFIIYVLNR